MPSKRFDETWTGCLTLIVAIPFLIAGFIFVYGWYLLEKVVNFFGFSTLN